LRSGIKSDRFATLSVKEIQDEIKSYNENHEEQSKLQIILLYKQAQWFAIGVNNPKKFPSLQKEFPDLFFDDPKPEQKKGKSNQKKPEKWEFEKMQMTLYAEAFNRNRKGTGT